MKNAKVIAIYLFLIIFIVLNNFIINCSLFSKYSSYITVVLLLGLGVVSYLMLKKTPTTDKYKYEKNQNIIIILIFYSIIYFSLGLIFGYEKTIYGKDFYTILKNILLFGSQIIATEYIRHTIVSNTKNNVTNNVIVSLLLAFITTNFISLIHNFTSMPLGFRYLITIMIPEIVTSFVLTYISRTSGMYSTLIYRLWLRMMVMLLPILPSLPWIITAIINLLLPMIIYFSISNFNALHDRRERRFTKSKYTVSTTILFIFTVFFILFILKAFKYFPISVLSNSMNPAFYRGDAIVIEKIDDSIMQELKEGDIIYYQKDNMYIIHRIFKIETKDNEKVFITKGDNNDINDSWYVYENDIIGILKLRIPGIGYPAVWFNDILNG